MKFNLFAFWMALWLVAGPVSAQDKIETPENLTTVTVTGKLPRDRASKPLTTITVTGPANLRALADKAGYDGNSAANFLFVVEKDTTIMGEPGGGTAIDTGVWPDTAYLALAINGKVYGGGGNGGDGGPGAKSGTKGGDAIYVRAPILIVIAESGAVEGGGGGGGGGEVTGGGAAEGNGATGGGGGGGGFPNGRYGLGGSGGAREGRAGRLQGPGQGGNNYSGTNWYWRGSIIPPPMSGRPSTMLSPFPGGNGGNAGRDGEPGQGDRGRGGGPGGYAIRANNIPVELILSGRIRGEIG